MITDFSMTSGLFNDIIVFFGGERSPLLQNPALYRTIYVLSDIWQQVGWGSIIYLSALSGVDAQLYDAASIDGAGRFQKLLHVTLPGIMPTIITMLILRIGSLMSIGYEKDHPALQPLHLRHSGYYLVLCLSRRSAGTGLELLYGHRPVQQCHQLDFTGAGEQAQ